MEEKRRVSLCYLQMIYRAVAWLGRIWGRVSRALWQWWPRPASPLAISPAEPPADPSPPSLPAIQQGESSSSRPLTPQEVAVLRGIKRERPEEDEYEGAKKPCRLLVDHLVAEKERLRDSLQRVSRNHRLHIILLSSAPQVLQPYEGQDLSSESLEAPSDTVI